jgi:chemotaxis protein methyltransferase CheR
VNVQDTANANGLELDDKAFAQIRQMIDQRAGIVLSESKRSMVYNRLVRRLKQTGCASFREYLDNLNSPTSTEWQPFVNALTTNLTSFFREDYHFPVLAEFLRKNRQAGRTLQIWCAAASTGQEPYSIAMTAIEALGANPPVRILATDIDTDVLATAERAVYPLDTVSKMAPERLRTFFLKGRDGQSGMVRVRPEVKSLIRFQTLNLVNANWSMTDRFDVVFCRNVMIYFERDKRAQVIQNFHRVLNPGGLLFVGHSETAAEFRTLFKLDGRTVYERVSEGTR